ncbi:hypothetical protein DdX_17209 [Ditylenchus destructor]|uniref:Uncharacterized protein n=1 Tax=Ditylenchus destructor TaxID=166010 RepID=A0AAD4MS95_9BILA|nr:hypothetical protein DdX_17209 [Ditylenchus destructor]
MSKSWICFICISLLYCALILPSNEARRRQKAKKAAKEAKANLEALPFAAEGSDTEKSPEKKGRNKIENYLKQISTHHELIKIFFKSMQPTKNNGIRLDLSKADKSLAQKLAEFAPSKKRQSLLQGPTELSVLESRRIAKNLALMGGHLTSQAAAIRNDPNYKAQKKAIRSAKKKLGKGTKVAQGYVSNINKYTKDIKKYFKKNPGEYLKI